MKIFNFPGVIILLLLCSISATSFANTHQKSWRFRVMLDETMIGHHTFNLNQENGKIFVSVEAEFNVKFLFFNAYAYKHTNNEVWRGKCLETIASKTNDNGEHFYLLGKNNGNSIQVETQKGSGQLSGCVKTFSYWDPDFLKSKKLLNAQTGELMSVNIQNLGESKIMVRGDTVDAIHYRVVTEEFSIDLWYSADEQEWLALKSTTQDGAVLVYEKI